MGEGGAALHQVAIRGAYRRSQEDCAGEGERHAGRRSQDSCGGGARRKMTGGDAPALLGTAQADSPAVRLRLNGPGRAGRNIWAALVGERSEVD
uniref:Uncharacterized protein n=1 Tax=Oryza meridionalis TaxID=40149 RepID=A0A0E0EW21_9ORYZ